MIFFFNPHIIEKYSHDIGDLVLLSCFVICIDIKSINSPDTTKMLQIYK